MQNGEQSERSGMEIFMQDIYRLGEERYAIYTGPSNPRFSPIMAGITLPDPGYEIRRRKSECYVFEYVLSGRGTVQQDEKSAPVRGGDVYLLHPGRFHHYYPDPQDPWEKIWFNVNGSLVRHLLSDYGLDGVLRIPGFGDAQYLQDILEAIRSDPAGSGSALELLLHRFLQALSAFPGDRSAGRSPALSMKNFIEQNLARPLSVDEIAENVHLSRSRAIHLFTETYGISPYRYYQSQRLELAQSMLRYTSLSVREIAEQLGFSDYRHFSGFFKKECGMPPLSYRKLC